VLISISNKEKREKTYFSVPTIKPPSLLLVTHCSCHMTVRIHKSLLV